MTVFVTFLSYSLGTIAHSSNNSGRFERRSQTQRFKNGLFLSPDSCFLASFGLLRPLRRCE